MQSGQLNRYCEIQERRMVRASDGSGDREEQYVTVLPIWAKIEGVSVKDLIASQAAQTVISHRVTLRFGDLVGIDIGPQYRIVSDGHVYRIIGALPDNKSGREYVTLACESGIFQWQDKTR